MRRLARCLMLLALVPFPAPGGEVLGSSITVDASRYHVSVMARIDAPPHLVYETITDYPNLPAVTPSIRSVEVLQVPGPSRHRIRTETVACILVFCKRVTLVQDVEQQAGWRIEAVTLPDMSDFRSGLAHWHLVPSGGGTQLHFDQTFVPDFWVPAVIGPWMIERMLLKEVRATTSYIERRHAGDISNGGE